MDNEQYGNFFQFPLALIASTERPFKELLRDAFYFGVVEFLNKTCGDAAELRFLSGKKREEQMQKARRVIGFVNGDAAVMLQGYDRAEEMRRLWVEQMGSTC